MSKLIVSEKEEELLRNPKLSNLSIAKILNRTSADIYYRRKRIGFDRMAVIASEYSQVIAEMYIQGITTKKISKEFQAPSWLSHRILRDLGLIGQRESKPKTYNMVLERGDYGREPYNYKEALDKEIRESAKYKGMSEAEYREWIKTPEGEYYFEFIQGREDESGAVNAECGGAMQERVRRVV